MKKQTLKRIMATILLTTLTLLLGCGSSSSDSSTSATNDSAAYATDDFYSTENYNESATEDVTTDDTLLESGETKKSDRKLIKNVDMNVETTKFDKLVSKLSQKVDAVGGYIESSDVYGDGVKTGGTRSAQYSIRIPKDKLDDFLETVAENSNITRKSENVQDVTLQYVDVQSKKEALEVEQDRLLELLESAQDIDTIVVLESKLTEIRYQLESLESQLRTYDNQVDYSTVNIYIEEVEIYTPEEPESRLEKLTKGFVSSVKGVFEDVLDFFVGLIIILPYLVVWGIIIFAFVSIFKFISRKRRERKEMKEQKKMNQEQ